MLQIKFMSAILDYFFKKSYGSISFRGTSVLLQIPFYLTVILNHIRAHCVYSLRCKHSFMIKGGVLCVYMQEKKTAIEITWKVVNKSLLWDVNILIKSCHNFMDLINSAHNCGKDTESTKYCFILCQIILSYVKT